MVIMAKPFSMSRPGAWHAGLPQEHDMDMRCFRTCFAQGFGSVAPVASPHPDRLRSRISVFSKGSPGSMWCPQGSCLRQLLEACLQSLDVARCAVVLVSVVLFVPLTQRRGNSGSWPRSAPWRRCSVVVKARRGGGKAQPAAGVPVVEDSKPNNDPEAKEEMMAP